MSSRPAWWEPYILPVLLVLVIASGVGIALVVTPS